MRLVRVQAIGDSLALLIYARVRDV
jgi:hypothetical protein